MFSHQRKQVNFPQDQQNSFELLDNTISTSEIRPILETYEQQLCYKYRTASKMWCRMRAFADIPDLQS